jgi:hypothetical protein
MKQFLGGMAAATLIWGAILFAQVTGAIDLRDMLGLAEDEEIPAETGTVVGTATDEPDKKTRKRRRGKRRGRRRGGSPMPEETYDLSEGVSGDALGAPGAKELAMGAAGGEDQLSSREIDQGIDRVFRGIERCLVLAPPGAPTTGKLTVGMHIASSGAVTKVNLRGPNVMIKGEVGACFRRIVKTIRFRSFDGPSMVVHYPIVFD